MENGATGEKRASGRAEGAGRPRRTRQSGAPGDRRRRDASCSHCASTTVVSWRSGRPLCEGRGRVRTRSREIDRRSQRSTWHPTYASRSQRKLFYRSNPSTARRLRGRARIPSYGASRRCPAVPPRAVSLPAASDGRLVADASGAPLLQDEEIAPPDFIEEGQ